MAEMFVPEAFEPPLEVRVGQYVLRPLSEVYLDVDLAAVNSSVDIIKETRGGTWPRGAITAEEDRTDLVEHRRQFEAREAFAYTIVTEDDSVCAGSVYVYPPNHNFDDSNKSGMPEDADAVINFWVTQKAYNEGFYPVLYGFVEEWTKDRWPFQRPFISNKLKVSNYRSS